jgi:hypothetical protein
MPSKPATKIVYPIDPAKCRPARHIPAHLYPLYDLMVGYAKAGGRTSMKFTASFMPTVCNALNLPENTVYRQRDQLEKLGWIVLLKEGGYDKKEKHLMPDEWRVIDHDEFIKRYPGTCPPNRYPANKFEEGVEVAVQTERRVEFRFVGSSPTAKAIHEVLSSLTPEQQVELREHWESIEWVDDNPLTDDQRKENARAVDELKKLRTNPLPIGNSLSPMAVQPFPLSMSDPFPYGCSTPSPTDRGASVNTPVESSLNTPTPYTVPANTVAEPVVGQKGVGGVRVEILPDHELDNEIDKLIREFVRKDGDPPQVTKPQKMEMKKLLKRDGRENFRAAARAWIKAEPWDARTTHPFASFIGGYAGYAAKKFFDDLKAAENDRQAIDHERTSQFWSRKFRIDHGNLKKDFLESLTQEDRDFITATAAAKTLEEMPPDNGRTYSVEELEFFKKQRAQAAAEDF